MCRLYGVTRAGYYAWRHRAPSARAEANTTLLQRIEDIHRRSHGTYGSPRIHRVLQGGGARVGQKRVARLMRAAGLTGRVVTVTRRAPGVHRFFEATDNLRVATAAPTAANQQWVGDVTYLKANGRPCLLAAVMDVYSRRIVGWAVGADRTVTLTTRAIQRAIRTRAPLSFRPRDRVRGVSLPRAPHAARDPPQHEPPPVLPGQRPYGVVLPHDEGRVDPRPDVHDIRGA